MARLRAWRTPISYAWRSAVVVLLFYALQSCVHLTERHFVRWAAPPSPPPTNSRWSTTQALAGQAYRPQHIFSAASNVRVDLEGLSLGDPLAPDPSEHYHAAGLVDALMRRYRTLDVNAAHPICNLTTSRYDSWLETSFIDRDTDARRVSIAINLHNSQSILPSLSAALIESIQLLSHTHYVVLSIFENGSRDQTRAMLQDLAAALTVSGLSELTIRSLPLISAYAISDRVTVLAALRNEALRPLLPAMGNGTVLFINDVVTCASDLLELLLQHDLQKADMVMSTDWWQPSKSWFGRRRDFGPQFYDVWVARGINGKLVYPFKSRGYSPIFTTGNAARDLLNTQDVDIHNRWLRGLPLPMYSGWNGAVAISGSLFVDAGMRFRASGTSGWRGADSAGNPGAWGRLVSQPSYLETDCAESECALLARDLWSLIERPARMVLAPQSRTAYSLADWRLVQESLPIESRLSEYFSHEEHIDWTSVSAPQSVQCVPSLTFRGKDYVS